ncbi:MULTISPECIES: hypothetical protein [Pontibacillus]|uniref:Uncharacterized protein n=1 Tax=Pontibacillus chungwhensis TaxID=265426 RepID=A0ABY8UWF7_9BACI|nr:MULTISPECIES: hypothetical protein [Pontibacillus]MCD5324106.1 hypothetical protein [Pontibacillus sp. HN14]WIF97837.1 hypothetical protein QNI29_19250 [Pontibacillus chungwhensis]
MKHLTKWVAASALTSAVVIAPAIHSTVDAAESNIEHLVYSFDGDTFLVSYEQFTNALIDQDGGLYDFVSNEQPTIEAVGLDSDAYVKYEPFVTAVFDQPDENPLALLDNLSNDSSNTLDGSVVDSYELVTNFDNGLPNPDGEQPEPVVPEVISID